MFRRELARARTFGFMRDVAKLWSAGYALGASFENTLVVAENRVLNAEGVRFPDEFVRHKAVDAIGDLALAGAPLIGAYRSVRGGHKLNHAVLCALMADRDRLDLCRDAGGGAARSRPCRSGRGLARAGLRPRRLLNRLNFSALIRADCGHNAVLSIGPVVTLHARTARWRWYDGPAGRGFITLMTSRLRGSRRPAPACVRLALSALALALLVAPSMACSLFNKDEDSSPTSPADKLYNQGPVPAERQAGLQGSGEEIRRSRPAEPVFGMGAQGAADVGLRLLPAAAIYRLHQLRPKRYVTLHPGSPDAAYAQYLIGASYYDQILDVSRDQARAEKAINALEEVVRKYPDQRIRRSARKKIEMARDQLAGKEMEVGRYYMNKRDFVGAINRFKVVVTQYQTTRHVEEALERLTEAYVCARHHGRGADRGRRAGAQFPGQRLVQGRLQSGEKRRRRAEPKTRDPG